MSGQASEYAYSVSLRAGRWQRPGHVEQIGIWHVYFEDMDRLPPHPLRGRTPLRVIVCDPTRDNGNNGIQVDYVSRVQFVRDGDRYFLRLYQDALGPETHVDRDDWFLGEEDAGVDAAVTSSAVAHARPGMLVFDENEVYDIRIRLRIALGLQMSLLLNPFLIQLMPAIQPAEPQPAAGAAAGAAADVSADISALLAAAGCTEADNLRAWRCAICFDGIETDRELMVAHGAHVVAATQPGGAQPGGAQPGGAQRFTQLLHVFHRHCLRNWQAWKGTTAACPTCKQALHPRPLPAVWSEHDGNMTLGARMGENPYIVTCN
jgi:hypothetical protein